jgi:hypothetical protein
VTAPFRAAVAFAFSICAAACAGPREPPFTTISARDAGSAVIAGHSTKADVIAALGKTTAVHFDSGFEVWVYQFSKNEYVILFAPSGTVAKTRIRPATAPRG